MKSKMPPKGTPASNNNNDPNKTPVCKDNIYYPKQSDNVEILYKKGARSIS